MLAVAASAPYHGDEVILKGPSGIITPHGPIGPTGPAHGDDHHYAYDGEDDGQYHGEHYSHGHYDDGQYHGEGAYYHHQAPAVALIAPSAHYYAAAPAHYAPHHEDGYVAYGHHGVAVKGPQTVPAVIAGPSGKVVAHGLYGVPNHHHSYHHYWFGGV